jgi:hypothetical protein
VNIHVRIFAILERLAIILAFTLKGADFIGKLRNEYHALIVVSLHPLLVTDAHYMLEAIMLFSFMIGFDHDWRCKKVMDRSFRLALYIFFVKVL